MDKTYPIEEAILPRFVRFGPYEVDRTRAELRKYGLKLTLGGQPLDVLVILLNRPNELVTREELCARLWPSGVFVDFERSLNAAVKKLRRALNDDAQEPRYIETQLRRGYRFIGTIDAEESSARKLASSDLSLDSSPSKPVVDVTGGITPQADQLLIAALPARSSFSGRSIHRSVGLVIAAIATVIAITLLLIYPLDRKAQATTSVAPKPVAIRSSIAVLGVKNLSSRRDTEWLATAIGEMLSTELATGEKIRIIPGETVTRAKLDLGLREKENYSRDVLRALRADLGTDYVVAGSYVALGSWNSGQVRMDLRLQETISGETLASISVQGKQSGIFDLVTRVGQEMRVKLGSRIPPEGDVDWRTVLPSNSEASRLYSEGLARLRLSDNIGAAELLDKSVGIEPNFPLGHAALAQAWSALGHQSRAIASSKRAISLASSLREDERLEIEGRYYELNQDWAGAIGVYQHLWQDFPDDTESGLRLAAAYNEAGKTQQALSTILSLRSFTAGQQDDPRLDLVEASVAAHKGDYARQQALAEHATIKAQSSGARLLLARALRVKAAALAAQNQLENAREVYAEALQILEKSGDRAGTATTLTELAGVLEKQGDLVRARELADRARTFSP